MDIYWPLCDSDEIRLLHLQPRSSSHESEIVCSLRHVQLSDYLEREVLSYMWGTTDSARLSTSKDTCVSLRRI
ncbi:hypothetical protein B0O99DRAFT_619107 [Bisporella sp. PMI_857]|nr:hypothetical protein B0O99DRAFT_619107 [Bisporella sp. PMI_857]